MTFSSPCGGFILSDGAFLLGLVDNDAVKCFREAGKGLNSLAHATGSYFELAHCILSKFFFIWTIGDLIFIFLDKGTIWVHSIGRDFCVLDSCTSIYHTNDWHFVSGEPNVHYLWVINRSTWIRIQSSSPKFGVVFRSQNEPINPSCCKSREIAQTIGEVFERINCCSTYLKTALGRTSQWGVFENLTCQFVICIWCQHSSVVSEGKQFQIWCWTHISNA